MSEYIPIIAHPERYLYFNNSDLSDLKKLKQMGCKFQMNLFSITNYYGRNVLKFSDRLLKNKLIDFVGSDIHGLSQLKEFDKKIMINSIKEIEKSIQKNIKYFS